MLEKIMGLMRERRFVEVSERRFPRLENNMHHQPRFCGENHTTGVTPAVKEVQKMHFSLWRSLKTKASDWSRTFAIRYPIGSSPGLQEEGGKYHLYKSPYRF